MPPWLTQGLAIYGALVGTGALVWNVYTGLRDRGRNRVWAGPDDPARKDVRLPTDTEPRFLVHVENGGRRDVAIERIWYTQHSTGAVKHLLTDRHDKGTEVVSEGRRLAYELLFAAVTPDDLDEIVVEAQDGRQWSGRYDRTTKSLQWE
jgi:hypothetical protein